MCVCVYIGLCESGCERVKSDLLAAIGWTWESLFWLPPNETKEENEIEKQNKDTGREGGIKSFLQYRNNNDDVCVYDEKDLQNSSRAW